MKNNTWQLIEKAVLETLEVRQMMSATPIGSATLSRGVLTVHGDANQSTNMVLEYSPDKTNYQVHSGGYNASFPVASVNKIILNGGSKADNIFVNAQVTAGIEIHGNGGDDIIHGGLGNDSIYGGDGNDLIYGGKGDNTLYGEAGNDTLLGDNGNDVLNGGDGNNFIVGASGNDTLIAGTGNSTMIGGAGNDMLTGGQGTDIENGGMGNDTLTGSDSSTLIGDSGKDTINGITEGKPATTTPAPTKTPVAVPTKTPVSVPTNAPVTAPVAKPVSAPIVVVGPVATPISVGNNPSNSVGVNAVIRTLAGIRQTGLAVNVDALASTFGKGTNLDTTYAWNFGDTGSYGNTQVGWNAAHVFDKSGSYTISLTLNGADGSTSTVTQSVTIAASTRTLVYVDGAAGSDSNTGSASAPFKTVGAAFAKLSDNTEILVKADQRYDISASLHIANSNIVLNRYGNGADPVLNRVVGVGASTVDMWTNCQGITIEHMTVDSPFAVAANASAPKTGLAGFYAAGQNVTVRNCTFLNIDDAINLNGLPTGTLIQNNSAPSITGLRGYFTWGTGTQAVVDGNTVANSTREHVVRCYGLEEATFENNNFTNADRSAVDSYDFSKGGIECQKGGLIYVTHNTLNGGDIRTGPLGLWGEPVTDSSDNEVILGNILNNTQVAINPGSHNVLVENNVIVNNNGQAIAVKTTDSNGRNVQNVTITHNTAIDNGTSGNFIWVRGAATNMALTNNLWIAPNITPGSYSTAAVYDDQADLSSFSVISNNIWPTGKNGSKYAAGGISVVNPAGPISGYVTPAQWNALPQVHNDACDDVTLTDTYQISLGDFLAGAAMSRAA